MNTTTKTIYKLPGFILIAISITLLFLAVMYITQTQFASVGWHTFASVSWNG